jgi:predicted Zn-dependent protease
VDVRLRYDHALGLVRRAVAERPDDTAERLWLGQVLLAAGQPREAEFRRATTISPRSPETWFALVQLLAREGRIELAGAAITEAEHALPEDAAPPALAVCHEAVGRIEPAPGRA